MSYSNLNEFILLLENQHELVRIKTRVETKFEITEIVDRVSKSPGGGKALLFENNGTAFPLLINAFGSEARMCLALGHRNLDEIGREIEELFRQLTGPGESILDKLKLLPVLSRIASWMPKKKSGRGRCQEVVMETPDLDKLPVLTCWPADGGPFITLPCVVTRDPITGSRNVGMYRMQVFGKDLTGMHWHMHKTGARHLQAYKALGKRMPVSVVLGGDPAYTYAATAPLPDQVDEYMLAGFLRKKKVELVRCLTNDLEVPDDADFILEGYVDPAEEPAWEGPFGDHTGFYSLADWYPKFHVTCITHRKGAVYPATVVGIPPQEDAYIGLATERIFLSPIRLTMLPELKDMYLPPAGVAHNLTLVRIEKSYPGQALKAMFSLWGAGQMMFNKIMVVTDRETSWNSHLEFIRTLAERVDPARDIVFSSGPMDVLDHSSTRFAYGSKMGIDASARFPEEENHSVPAIAIPAPEEFRILPEKYSFVAKVNTDLLSAGIPVIILGIVKEAGYSFSRTCEILSSFGPLQGTRFIVLSDAALDIQNLYDVTWYVTGNLDPKRDTRVFEQEDDNTVSRIVIDGTRKTTDHDRFTRNWPNPVVSSPEIIDRIDKIWPSLGLGEFLPSPSLRYLGLKNGDGAIAD